MKGKKTPPIKTVKYVLHNYQTKMANNELLLSTKRMYYVFLKIDITHKCTVCVRLCVFPQMSIGQEESWESRPLVFS